MNCLLSPNSTIITGAAAWQFAASFAEDIECTSTYLRPDPGGALIPWLYAIFLLLFHLPACIIRALRWESGQYLALSLALLSVVLCIQSYTSTHLAPANILVWMPLTLMLDVGAMLQMVVLIIEKYDGRPGGGIRTLGGAIKNFFTPRGEIPDDGIALAGPPGPVVQGGAVAHPGLQDPAAQVLTHAIVCLAASALFLTLVILQAYGLYAAAHGLGEANISHLTAKWCSPSFRDFAIAIRTGNCDTFYIADSSSNGIGCIELPAQQQLHWLTSTVAVLAVSLVIQAIDMVLIRFARGRTCRGADMQRPWFTMVAGVLTLVILITFGIFNAARLPAGSSDPLVLSNRPRYDDPDNLGGAEVWLSTVSLDPAAPRLARAHIQTASGSWASPPSDPREIPQA
ncbi:hypothetical protein MAPG_09516 [Magnaporthiopsis poae ATCC 64411]|uniref:Uncharacterized protein n=1 Tax=Magnaporthiopsis poae (strain ATCC 64411 / 73-15) TaxID=644358 RepID=A0A0C4EA57_MAGP6|nr:hypothetical protein MAPG_09516 [Magnaporthiopsis poae ATCC 64411]